MAAPIAVALASHDSCPCINNTEANLCQGSHRAMPDGSCYPREYGSSACATHDEGLTAECVQRNSICRSLDGAAVPCSARTGWCSSRWCWVDPAGCSLPHRPSSFFPNTSLHYSYQTCGNLDDYGPTRFVEKLSSPGELRVSFTGSSSSGFTIVSTGDPVYGANFHSRDFAWRGSVVSFFSRVWMEYGRTRFTIVPVSESSRNFSESSFTACVHELALGTTDACIGNLWPTLKRKVMAGFTSAIYEDTFHLVVRRRQRETGLWRQVQSSFPDVLFAWYEEWVMIFGFLVFVSVAMWLIEGHSNEEDFQDSTVLGGLLRSLFYQLQSFFGMGDYRYTPHTFAGRIVLVSTSLVLLVALTHLTAMMTADEVRAAQAETEFQELNDLIQKQVPICGPLANQDLFKRTIPGAQNLYVPVVDASAVLAGVDAGACGAGILTADEWRIQKARAANCDKVRLPATLYTQDNAFAMRDDLIPPFSWAMDRLQAEYPHFQDQAQQEFPVIDECLHMQEDEVVARRSVVLLPTVFSTFAVALALVVYAVGDALQARKRRDDDPFAVPSLAERLKRLCGAGRNIQRRPSVDHCLESIRERDADLRMVSKILAGRSALHRLIAHRIKDNAPITIGDLPMLVQILAEKVREEVLAAVEPLLARTAASGTGAASPQAERSPADSRSTGSSASSTVRQQAERSPADSRSTGSSASSTDAASVGGPGAAVPVADEDDEWHWVIEDECEHSQRSLRADGCLCAQGACGRSGGQRLGPITCLV